MSPTKIKEKTAIAPQLSDIRSLVDSEMNEVDKLLKQQLSSEVEIINQLGQHIINSGGKRLRPVLTLLSAGICDDKKEQHIHLAAIIELIHTATLLHDDVVDASLLRRGHETANHLWGNETSVLVGDFLYSRAFQMMVNLDSMLVMDILSKTTNTIAAGEVLQLINKHNPLITEADYLHIISHKTAKLFEAAAQLSPIIANQTELRPVLASYGHNLGMAFQLIDDLLDYQSSATQFGKNVGDDLAEGKPTLPLLYAMWHSNEKERELIYNTIKSGGLEHISAILKTIKTVGAIDYTEQLANQYANKALCEIKELPPTRYKKALIQFAHFAVHRCL